MAATMGDSYARPTRRLEPYTVFRGLVSICPLAGWPTTSLPRVLTAMMEGTVLWPSRLLSTPGLPLRTYAAHEFVVPRSMPITTPARLGSPVFRSNAASDIIVAGAAGVPSGGGAAWAATTCGFACCGGGGTV